MEELPKDRFTEVKIILWLQYSAAFM
jgi:hypothetical protein